MKITPEIREELRKPFPPEAISQHPTKTFLSTIKAIYIVERLNDIFGIGGWNIESEIVEDTTDYVSMKGRITIGNHEDSDYFTTPYQYGGHKKTGKNTEPADGYKSAVTDCQSKCASYLEIGIDIFKGKGDRKPRGVQQQPPQSPGSKSGGQSQSEGPTEKQRKFLKGKMQKSGMDTLEKRGEFYKFVLSNSDDGETRRWASDFLDQYDNYFQTYQDSIVDKIA